MPASQENTVLILAPVGRDAASMAAMLGVEGVPTRICSDPMTCVEQLAAGAGTLLLTEEALELPRASAIFEFLEHQPAWSELPVVVLTRGGESRVNELLDLASAVAGNVTLLERPMKAATLLRSVQVALRSRARQYQVRELLAEQQRQRQELRESEEWFRTLADNISQFAWMADETGWIFWYNQRWFDYTGTTLEEMKGWGWKKVHHPDHLDRVVARVQHSWDTGELWEDTFPLRGKDGQYRWFLSRARPIRNETGSIVRWFGTNTDITEQRQAEEALRQSEQRLLMAKSAGNLGIHEYRPASNELIWDDRMRELWGLDPEDPVNYEIFMSGIHPDDRASVQAAVDRAIDPKGNGRYYAEYRLADPNRTVWIAANGHVTFENAGAARLVGTVQDVTERKEFEAELERKVAERTAKLQEMVGELQHMGYAIVHDMRAPLRGMQAFADVLREEADTLSPHQRQDYCARIAQAAHRLDALIQDALAYNRLVLQEVPMEPVDLMKLVTGILDTYPNLHADKAAVAIEGTLPVVIGNEALLTQCFSNLLGNAAKFVRPETPPRVRIWPENQGGSVRVWVEDNGIGIPENARNRLFKMFERIHPNYEGTGIGLAIVRKVVEQMGGSVGMEPGVSGSRFWVQLRCPPAGR